MKNFHVIDSASHAYEFVWNNRQTIARYAAIPFIIKIICLTVILMLDASENFLRQGLILLPAHFAEGWFTATIIMMCMQSIPKQTSLMPNTPISTKQRLQGSIAIYVLIQLTMAVLLYIAKDASPIADQAQGQPVSTTQFLSLIALLITIIWAFRLTLLHIPIAMGYGMRRYLRTFKTYAISFRMIALILICTMPPAVLMIITLNAFGHLFDLESMSPIPTGLIFGSVQSLTQMIVLALSSTAMTYAFYPFFTGNKIKP